MRTLATLIALLACTLLDARAGDRTIAEPCPWTSPVAGLPDPDIVRTGSRAAALLRCAAQGRIEEGRKLLDAGVESPLAPAYAAAAGRDAFLEMLLERGADPNARGMYNDAPILALAVARGHERVVALLLEAGADPDLSGDGEFSGGSALGAAVRAGRVDLARLLLEHGADVNRRESYHGWTPVWELVCKHFEVDGFHELVDLLAANDADFEARDSGGMDGWPNSGRTPLACAVVRGDVGLARRLMSDGADTNALVDGGRRVLELTDDPEMVRLLESGGATASRELPSTSEVYEALAADGFAEAREFYMLGARRVKPARMRDPFPAAYRGHSLQAYVAKDLDGDGAPELSVVLQRPGERPAALVVAILGRRHGAWRVLHRRDSLEGNPVRSASLEDTPDGVGVHVFEVRYQCDDEQPIHYGLRWDRSLAAVHSSVPSPHLHPYKRNWDCGE